MLIWMFEISKNFVKNFKKKKIKFVEGAIYPVAEFLNDRYLSLIREGVVIKIPRKKGILRPILI